MPSIGVRVALVIDRLGCGGSERQFVMLARALQQRGHSVVAMVFYPGGAFESELRAADVRVRVLNKRGRWDIWRFGLELARAAREEQPSVLYGFACVPNLALVLVKRLIPGARIIWGVRASNLPLKRYGRLPRALGSVAVALSRQPDLVISNSFAGLVHAVKRGYPAHKLTVIPNGVDTERFAPCREAGARIRAEWNVNPSETLVGLVGRLDPMKGHLDFLQAAALLERQRRNLRFVCVGDGDSGYRARLQASAIGLGLADRVRWVPHHANMAELYNALDILCSASIDGEGFPNVLGEAMACGIPCVVTDVGDSARVLNCSQLTAPSGNPATLAGRIATLLDMPDDQRARLAAEGRHRIMSEYSIAHLVDATENAILRTLNGDSR